MAEQVTNININVSVSYILYILIYMYIDCIVSVYIKNNQVVLPPIDIEGIIGHEFVTMFTGVLIGNSL